MAKRFREFKRVRLTSKTAKHLQRIAEITLLEHYETCRKDECRHVKSGNLAVARLIESRLQVSSHRAHIDIPDDPQLAQSLARRLRDFSASAAWARTALICIADTADAWARRSNLERLAEAGLELDEALTHQ